MNKVPAIGCRLAVDYDEHCDLGFIVPVMSNKKGKVINCKCSVMVHKATDFDGVILWFDMEAINDD